ncbi:MAG TPA: glycosyltransferase family 39 protein [Candidatus Acidoferrales bacterium]|nr:glycosyltransferase family 39 protein [Candidatus Acidoferrales bacterium]
MTASLKMRAHITGAVLAAFALRLYFVWRFPFYEAGDTPIYQQLAHNWLRHGVYGLEIAGRLTPVDIRVPGYPALLAAIYIFFGESARAVMVAQALLGVLTCFLVAAMAAVLAPKESRRRVALAALWLAALCPFTANYTAVVLTETLTIFLSTLALLVLMEALRGVSQAKDVVAQTEAFASMPWLIGGIVVGLGTLVRPETPLILAAAGAVLLALWWRPKNWPRLLQTGTLLAVGLILPLLPWAARNWRVVHTVQFLAPRYSELPGEFTPHGFYAWTGTWLWRFGDVFLVPWNVDGDKINIEDLRASTFDSPAERARVATLLATYNEDTDMTPEIDRGFAEIARERTARHPLRTYFTVPLLRCFSMWFTPRVEMLPLSGHLWPIHYWWEDSEPQYCVSLGLFLLGIAYGVMALVGAWRVRKDPVAFFLVAYIVIRTGFLTTIETPEPRYVLECFPVVFALAAQLWTKRTATVSS